MLLRTCGLMLLTGCAIAAGAQGSGRHYMDRANILHNQGLATVDANDPRPLLQAVTAVREEYGWAVDYEDPPYSGTVDLVRDSSMCRQPCGKGFLIPAGGAFQSTYPEGPDMWSSANAELQTLEKIVSDYNATQNPGKFVVREQADGSYAVIGDYVENSAGAEVSVPPILDIPISLPSSTRSAAVTTDLILDALNKASGTVVGSGIWPLNALAQSQVTVGGSNVPARDLLLQTIDQIKSVKLVWELLGDSSSFYLSLLPVQKAHYDAFGRKTTTIVH